MPLELCFAQICKDKTALGERSDKSKNMHETNIHSITLSQMFLKK